MAHLMGSCREMQLVSGQQVAIDGSKVQSGRESIDQSLTRSQVERDRAEIEEKIHAYLRRLDQADDEDAQRSRTGSGFSTRWRDWLPESSGSRCMSTACRSAHAMSTVRASRGAPDARPGREGTVLGYNVQSAVEAQSGLIVHHEVTDAQSDTNQLLGMATGTKEAPQVETLAVLADAGYPTASIWMPASAKASRPRSRVDHLRHRAEFQKIDFKYEAEQDR